MYVFLIFYNENIPQSFFRKQTVLHCYRKRSLRKNIFRLHQKLKHIPFRNQSEKYTVFREFRIYVFVIINYNINNVFLSTAFQLLHVKITNLCRRFSIGGLRKYTESFGVFMRNDKHRTESAANTDTLRKLAVFLRRKRMHHSRPAARNRYIPFSGCKFRQH